MSQLNFEQSTNQINIPGYVAQFDTKALDEMLPRFKSIMNNNGSISIVTTAGYHTWDFNKRNLVLELTALVNAEINTQNAIADFEQREITRLEKIEIQLLRKSVDVNRLAVLTAKYPNE